MLIRKYSLEVWYINILGNAVAEKFVGKEFQENVFFVIIYRCVLSEYDH